MLNRKRFKLGRLTRIARRMALVLAFAFALLAASRAATVNAATTLYVSPTGSDANPCTSTLPCRTIGHAISVAFNGSTIRVAAGRFYENLTIGHTGGALPIKLTIEGDGTSNTIVDGGGKGTVVTLTTLAFVTISAVAIEHGRWGGIANHGGLLLNKSLVGKNVGSGITNQGTMVVTDSIVKGNSSLGSGGGLTNYGTLTLIRSTIADNTSAGAGGGIYNAGPLTLRQSTVAHDRAVYEGGGIYTDYKGSATLLNSTVAGNFSGTDGGGLFSHGSALTVFNSTIASNAANTSLTGASGGGVAVTAPIFVTLSNTILASNVVSTSVFPFHSFNDCEVIGFGNGAIASDGYNLVSTLRGCAYGADLGDQIGVSPQLGPLQNNGGPTQTMALQPGSPAIDAGNLAGCRDQNGNLLATDQRGDPRPHEGDGDGDNRCDIGAYEK